MADGFGGRWEPDTALRIADAVCAPAKLREWLLELQASQQPAPRAWLGERLTVLWNLFNTTRAADGRALTGWMMEVARLVADVPHDILALAIDQAIRSAKHNFMPSVGEIRAIADPLAATRAEQVQRLELMLESAAANEAARGMASA